MTKRVGGLFDLIAITLTLMFDEHLENMIRRYMNVHLNHSFEVFDPKGSFCLLRMWYEL